MVTFGDALSRLLFLGQGRSTKSHEPIAHTSDSCGFVDPLFALRRPIRARPTSSPAFCLLLTAFCLLHSPAADEVDNLKPVTVRQQRLWPVVSAHDLLIQLNCNPFRRQREFAYQLAELQFVGHLTRFTVDLNLQCLSLSSSGRQDHAAQLGRLSIGLGAQKDPRAASFKRRQRRKD